MVSTEIERKEMPRTPPNPIEVLNGIAVMQAFTIGLLIANNVRMGMTLRRLSRIMPVKEVVVVYKEAKEASS